MSKTKKNIKVRDLKPRKDAKGGGSFKPNAGTAVSGSTNPQTGTAIDSTQKEC
jgi:hypothetical protein